MYTTCTLVCVYLTWVCINKINVHNFLWSFNSSNHFFYNHYISNRNVIILISHTNKEKSELGSHAPGSFSSFHQWWAPQKPFRRATALLSVWRRSPWWQGAAGVGNAIPCSWPSSSPDNPEWVPAPVATTRGGASLHARSSCSRCSARCRQCEPRHEAPRPEAQAWRLPTPAAARNRRKCDPPGQYAERIGHP